MDTRALLRKLKEGLQAIYGDRLKGVYAYGSYARGEEDDQSDLDILTVLECVDHYAVEIDRTGPRVSELSLKAGISISRVFVSEREWIAAETPFLASVREEAVPA